MQIKVKLIEVFLLFFVIHRFYLESALDINVNNKTYEQNDLENINWISHLTYLDPNADIRDCTAQG